MKNLLAGLFVVVSCSLPQLSLAEPTFDYLDKTILFRCGEGLYNVHAKVKFMHGWNWSGFKPTYAISFEGNEQSFPSTEALNQVCGGEYLEENIYFDDFRASPLAISYSGKKEVKFKRYGPLSREHTLKVGQIVRTTQAHCGGAEAEITDLSDRNGIFVQLKYSKPEASAKCLGGSYCNAFNGRCIELE